MRMSGKAKEQSVESHQQSMEHQICVACGRKQSLGKKSCQCGHVMREDIAIGNETGASGPIRLRGKRCCASMDETSIDLVLEDFFLRDASEVNRAKLKKNKSAKRIRSKGQLEMPLNSNRLCKIRKPLTSNEVIPKLDNSKTIMSHASCLKVPHDKKLEDQQNCGLLEASSYPTALEDINQKLLRQNRICRMAYV